MPGGQRRVDAWKRCSASLARAGVPQAPATLARPRAGSEPSARRCPHPAMPRRPALRLAEVTRDNALARLLPAPSHTPRGTMVLSSPTAPMHGDGAHRRAGTRGWAAPGRAAASAALVALLACGAAPGKSRWTHLYEMSPAWGQQRCGSISLPRGAAPDRHPDPALAGTHRVCPQPPGTALLGFTMTMFQKPHFLHRFILAQPEVKEEQTKFGLKRAKTPCRGCRSIPQLFLQLLANQAVPAPARVPLGWHSPVTDP